MQRIVHLATITAWDYVRMWRIARSQTSHYKVEIHARAPFEHQVIEGIDVYGYPGGTGFRERFERLKLFRRKMLDNPPDFIQINSPEQLLVLLELQRRRGVRAVFDSYEYYPDAVKFTGYAQGKLRQPFFRWFSSTVIPALARRTDLTLTSDIPTAQYYESERVRNVQALMNFPFTEEIERAFPARPEDHPELHYGGVLTMDRGGSLMLDAIQILRERGTRARMIMTGPPVADPTILPWDDALAKRGLSDWVEHRGYVSLAENYDLMGWAKVAVLPTSVERYRFNIPQKIFYYLAWGVPVVTTRLPALQAVLPADLPGVVYVPEEAGAIADAVQGLLMNEAERVQAGQAARAWIRKHTRWEPEQEKLLAAYAKLSKCSRG